MKIKINLKLLDDYKKLVKSKKVYSIVFDGLDGVGKGTLANLLSKKLVSLSHNVVYISLPVYTTEYGKIIKHLLTTSDENLTIEERMYVYAINRLEIITEIINKAYNLYQKNPNSYVVLIFDRFVTSNVLTIAYYISKNKTLNLDVDKYLKKIPLVDKLFLDILELENIKVFIPSVDIDVALTRIKQDKERNFIDMYETANVQIIANTLYQHLSKMYIPSLQIQILKIDIEEKPEQIINKCINFLEKDTNYNQLFCNTNEKTGSLDTIQGDESYIFANVLNEIRKILYAFPNIQKLYDKFYTKNKH
ncbi:MAG: hypothetical protein NZZ41_05885 [Candidatus Dojkabacteria bacterium]|nr:hypothetical protein [Candidatus Dojkabacteria bacterium]